MTLEKAIEILTSISQEGPEPDYNEYLEATNLGIEALKRIHDRRQSKLPGYVRPLIGETED